ncbi:NAD(P)-dependent oxidoreductase [Cohnella lupini]|uniref:Putative NADH-flavin reductase n=1 Tax=Cohnella lupini TaxID=1294267 RepID=A0A3D9I1P7_9BACL|nr:SDR family oxidoreductase [Cohnella lupini]RED55692.1 putative NADH-flavin reductase [Cohnella lupini]
MNIAVFGANGPTGRLLTKQAIEGGHRVTAVTRNPEAFPLRNARLNVFRGDVYDLASVEQAIEGQDAVLSTLGVPFSRQPISVYSQGMDHIAKAMNKHGVRRLVCVSSSATDPHIDPDGGFIFEKIVQPAIIKTIGRTLYEDMRRMEQQVKASNLDWTIVRPSGLFETLEVTPYQMAETYIKGRFTSRNDLAACLLEQASSEEYVRKVVAVATTAVKPSMLKLIMKEAFQKKHK